MKIIDLIGKLPQARPWQKRKLSSITRIVVHHSAAPVPVVAMNQLVAFAKYHISHGWRGLGYHYAIDDDGTVYKCNALTSITSHAKGGNSDSIGIVLLGNFDAHRFVDGRIKPSWPLNPQLRSLKQLVKVLRDTEPSIKRIMGHRDVKGSHTACPGRYFTDGMIQAAFPT